MTKVYGASTDVTNSLGSILPGIGQELLPVEGAGPFEITGANVVYTPVLLAASFVDQQPVALDTPIQINFGAPQSNAFVDLDANGTLTFLTPGFYLLDLRGSLGRTTNPGAAVLFARSLWNGTQIGNSLHANIPDQETQIPFFAQVPRNAVANDTFEAQIMRSSLGINAGGLFTESTAVPGWNNSPSVQVTVQRVTIQVTP